MKVWNYIIIATGLTLLFEMAGIPIASNLLSYLGLSLTGASAIKSAALYLAIFGGAGILIGLGAGIAIGYITKSSPENFIILPILVTSVTLFIAPLIEIISYSYGHFDNWIFYIILFIMGILTTGFIFAMVEFFRGTD